LTYRYSTFRALLYYLYTNQIRFVVLLSSLNFELRSKLPSLRSFTPLASTFYAAKDRAFATNIPFTYTSRKAFILAHSPHHSRTGDGVGPASAKALYRLADKMGLVELKELAFKHIVSSLTPQNVSLYSQVGREFVADVEGGSLGRLRGIRLFLTEVRRDQKSRSCIPSSTLGELFSSLSRATLTDSFPLVCTERSPLFTLNVESLHLPSHESIPRVRRSMVIPP